MLSYPELTEDEDTVIRDLLSQFETVPLTLEIEEIAVTLRRQRRIKTPDAILAATAIHINACLVTRNTADFKNMSEFQIYNPWD